MSNIRAICFDLFHTLIDVGSVPDEVGAYTADLLGIDRETWNASCFSPHHKITEPTRHIDVIRTLAHSIDPSIPEEKIREAVDHRQRRFDYALMFIPVDILEDLQRLRHAGYQLCLVSNASTAEVSAWEKSPLSEIFDEAIISCHCGYAKPDPDIYHHAARQLGVRPDECLFVGDGGSNEHEGAANVGMHPVLMTYYIERSMSAERLAERRSKVRHEVGHMNELLSLLECLNVAGN
jgi:putative hydrolase of the HAD superfamily